MISVLQTPASIFQARLRPAVEIYVDAMGYARTLIDARTHAWARHMRNPNWCGAMAIAHPDDVDPTEALADLTNPLVGVAYCYTGQSNQWWSQQVRAGMAQHGWKVQATAAVLSNYCELTEIHVSPNYQGHGIGRTLLQELMRDRPDQRVLLSTPEVPAEANRAWQLYRSLGFVDILRDFYFPGDDRPFAILGAKLPLTSTADVAQ
ncbi:GNAT family N-acetyltransferase [Corynebacterium ulceribovis]|uniref:GNAT family N-acetyltransferase n=1 Tax=Corynebacterium ulceribovis TaxID=487732 RepID=UPI000369F5AF|nr:N-acetyltransferase [Corynebacterium ulceribovis]